MKILITIGKDSQILNLSALTMTVLALIIIVSPVSGIPIRPENFGPAAKVEDFEGLANVVFTEVNPFYNPHYVVRNDYLFNGDFSLTQPNPNPLTPGSSEAVKIGDFAQGTLCWGYELYSAEDVPSGSAYLGLNLGSSSSATFTFNSGMFRVGAWTRGYLEYPVELSALDSSGSVIESVTQRSLFPFPSYWSNWFFLGIESQTPIWGVTITGDYPAVDNLMYEGIPEPATICLLGLGALSTIRRKK